MKASMKVALCRDQTYSNTTVFHHHLHQFVDLKMLVMEDSVPLHKIQNQFIQNPPRITSHDHDHDQKKKKKKKIIVIMGATGTGKSRLSIDLGTHFSPCYVEIINSDKIQIYKGLQITTNKLPMSERLSIPHHLIDELDSSTDGELSPSDFRSLADPIVEQISSRNHLPILVGGSNSFIHALLTEDFESDSDGSDFESVSAELRYDCCFLCVDVSLPVLKEYLCKRVEEMFDGGMFQELAEFYKSEPDVDDSVPRVGIRKAIGVPEFEQYFRFFPPAAAAAAAAAVAVDDAFSSSGDDCDGMMMDDDTYLEAEVARGLFFEKAKQAIKDNTYKLAEKQIEKIQRLKSAGWDIQKLNATEVFRAMESDSGKSWSEIWEKEVVAPSVKIVKQFLEE